MALIKCPECGRDVSDKADDCIHCGFPLTQTIGHSTEHSNYGQNQQAMVQNKSAKHFGAILIVIIVVAIIIFAFALQNSGSTKLNGEYVAQTAFSDNLINFSNNGGFARFARTFGDWQLVTGGKYSLKGSSLILYCSDGRVHKFYYDRANDTMTQEGTNDVYIRTNQ